MNVNRNHYDAVIIGFGKGGKTLAGELGSAGKKVVLVEQSSEMYGGTCINVGCIPTKYLVLQARQVSVAGGSFAERSEAYQKAISGKEMLTGRLRAKNFNKAESNPNVTVITGKAKLTAPHEIEVATDAGTERLEADSIFLNTGARPFIPPIAGLKENPYVYTSEQMMELKQLPEKLVIIGGGYIGIEFASIYADFGSQVTMLQDGERFLPREDEEIAAAVRESLADRDIKVMTGVQVTSVEESGQHAVISVEAGGRTIRLDADAILVATGRRPDTAGLGLENAGVELNARGGVVVDDSMRTTAPHIYAMGDVTGGLQFTYLSLDDYRIVRSALLGDGSYTLKERGAVPYSVFLNPPFSRVGMSEQEAIDKGYRVKVGKLMTAAIPRAQVTGQLAGMLKVVVDEETGLILGAHLFCDEAHEMINLIKLAIDAKLPYTVLRDTIYTHPTMSESFNELFQI